MSAARFAVAVAIAVGGCGDLAGFGGQVPPLVSFQLAVTGDPAAAGADVSRLRVALVWGDQWLTEPICILPPESAEVAATLAAGCRDPFGFVPLRVDASVAIVPGQVATLSLFDLPTAGDMIGDVTARIAYGTLVLFDDRDGSGALELQQPRRPTNDPMQPPDQPPAADHDLAYGASFLTMTEPDQRVGFREGAFNPAAAFYPRRGCGEPPPSFSILAAGGFTAEAALAATLRGELPLEDPAACSERAPADAPVTVAVRPPAEAGEAICEERRSDSSIRFREPPAAAPDLTMRTTACAKLADFGGGASSGVTQLLITSRADEPCKSLSHYVLRGCRDDALCALPRWDLTASPPAWWPCPVVAP